MLLRELGNGLYQTALRPFERGIYRATAEVLFNDRTLGRDTTEFSVSMFNPEFIDTRARPELLEALAVATGGKSGPPDSLSAVLMAIHFPSQTVVSNREIEFFWLPLVMMTVLLLLFLEWFIRKRKGMV
jgi:hypothetical protein